MNASQRREKQRQRDAFAKLAAARAAEQLLTEQLTAAGYRVARLDEELLDKTTSLHVAEEMIVTLRADRAAAHDAGTNALKSLQALDVVIETTKTEADARLRAMRERAERAEAVATETAAELTAKVESLTRELEPLREAAAELERLRRRLQRKNAESAQAPANRAAMGMMWPKDDKE